MRKKIISIIFLFTMVFTLSACGFLIFDENEADANMRKVVDCLEKEDKVCLKALFAPNAISDIKDFDKSMDDLITYFDGTYKETTRSTVGEDKTVDYGKITKMYPMSYDIVTTENKYRIAMDWYVIDDFDKGNIGIHSLYVIIYDDQTPDEMNWTYWGDGTNRNGIHIGLRPAYGYFKEFIDTLLTKDKESIKVLFAPNAISGIENFDKMLENFYSYYKNYNGINYISVEIFENKFEESMYYTAAFETITANAEETEIESSHLFALKWYIKDTLDGDNIGVWSCYVIESDRKSRYSGYNGDGFWTSGIHTGIGEPRER